MARYYFHIHQNGQLHKDSEGTELDHVDLVRREAMHTLPEIAHDEVPKDGDQQAFMVLVTAEDGEPVYSATMTFAGFWLNKLA